MTTIFWIFIALAGIALVCSIVGMIQEDIDTFGIWLFVALILVLVAFFVNSVVIDQTRLDNCIDAGYMEAQHRGSNWYCISFGNEPRIVRLEGE